MHVVQPVRRDGDGPSRSERYARTLVALTRVVWHQDCTLDDALAMICSTAAETLDVPRVNVWQYDAEHGELRCLHDYDHAARLHVTSADALETLTLADSDYIASLEVVRAIDADDVDSDPSTSRSVGALRDFHNQYSPSTISGTLSTWPMVSQPKAR